MSFRRKLLLAVFVGVVVLNWTWGKLPPEPAPPPQSKYAMVDGVKVHYLETKGRGPGVIMVHGHPGTYLDWSYVQQKLPGVRTIAIDRPGYGYSSGGYVEFDDQVKLIRDLGAKLGMKRPVIAGHSYGGTLAVAYAQRYPRQTGGIVAVAPALDPDAISARDRLQAHLIKFLNMPVVEPIANATFSQATRTALANPQVETAFAPDPINEDYKMQVKSVTLKSSDMKTMADEALDFDGVIDGVLPGLPGIKTPVTVIQGRGDELVSASSTAAASKEIPRVRYISLPGGHMVTWVTPEKVAAAVRRYTR